jgi:hypothetical protein
MTFSKKILVFFRFLLLFLVFRFILTTDPKFFQLVNIHEMVGQLGAFLDWYLVFQAPSSLN